jgi:cyclic nucleotide gated channel
MRRFFAADITSVLPFPQVVIWNFLHRSRGTAVLDTKDRLLFIVFIQYIPRVVRIYPISSELKRSSGAFAETAYAGAAYYLLWYLLASHVRASSQQQFSRISIADRSAATSDR